MKLDKRCENCTHYIPPFGKESNIPYCGINGLETKTDFVCSQFEFTCARNMYALCSSSECLECPYFIKHFRHCNIGAIV